MLFYAKQRARVAALVMIGLIILADVWANLHEIPLGEMIKFNLPSVFVIALGLIFVMSLDSVIYLVNWFVGYHPFLNAFDSAIQKLFARVSVAAIITGGLLAALGEETFFRGVLQSEWGLVPTAILFALAHVGRGFNLFAAWALLEGLIFGWLYQLSGNLLVPMVVHGLHDALSMVIARYLYKRVLPPADTLFDWLKTLSQPPEHSPRFHPAAEQPLLLTDGQTAPLMRENTVEQSDDLPVS